MEEELFVMMKHIKKHMIALKKDEDGAAMVEYGLLVALIAVVVVAALTPLGVAISTMFAGITGSI